MILYPLRTLLLTTAVLFLSGIIIQTARANNLGLPDKLWDYFEPLLVPVALAVGIFLLERFQREQEAAREERQQAREKEWIEQREAMVAENADEQRKQAELSAYLDRVTTILMTRNATSTPDLVVTVVRTATLQALTSLNNDKPKIQQVLDFLRDADLLQDKKPLLGKGIFRSANLKGRDLANLLLQGADLQEAILTDTLFAYANLSQTNLSGASVVLPEEEGKERNQPDWRSVILKEAYLEGLKLSGSNLSDANLSNAFCAGVDFGEAWLINTSMVETDIRGANFGSANLQRAKLQKAIIDEQTLWPKADLRGADLSGTDLQHMNWQAVKIDSTTFLPDPKWFLVWEIANGLIANNDLSGRDLSYARLVKVDLQKANLSNCSFIGTDLTEANLAHSDLSNANLQEAILTKTDLHFANLTGVLLEEEPKIDYKWRIVHALVNNTLDELFDIQGTPPLFKNTPQQQETEAADQLVSVDLSMAYLGHCNLRGRRLTGANLSESILKKADLTDADLTGANLKDCDLTEAILCRATLRGARMQGCKLPGAQLEEANLQEANLTNAEISGEQLKTVKSLYKTILPNGQTYFQVKYTGD